MQKPIFDAVPVAQRVVGQVRPLFSIINHDNHDCIHKCMYIYKHICIYMYMKSCACFFLVHILYTYNCKSECISVPMTLFVVWWCSSLHLLAIVTDKNSSWPYIKPIKFQSIWWKKIHFVVCEYWNVQILRQLNLTDWSACSLARTLILATWNTVDYFQVK